MSWPRSVMKPSIFCILGSVVRFKSQEKTFWKYSVYLTVNRAGNFCNVSLYKLYFQDNIAHILLCNQLSFSRNFHSAGSLTSLIILSSKICCFPSLERDPTQGPMSGSASACRTDKPSLLLQWILSDEITLSLRRQLRCFGFVCVCVLSPSKCVCHWLSVLNMLTTR